MSKKISMLDPYSYSIFNPDFVEGVLNDWISYDNPSGYVYFISDLEYIKIGHTTNLKDRISTLQVGNPRKLKLLYVIPCQSKADAKEIEWHLHKWYKRYEMSGEWYDILDKIDRHFWELYFSPKEYIEVDTQ